MLRPAMEVIYGSGVQNLSWTSCTAWAGVRGCTACSNVPFHKQRLVYTIQGKIKQVLKGETRTKSQLKKQPS